MARSKSRNIADLVGDRGALNLNSNSLSSTFTDIDFTGTGSITLPVGTTAQRDSSPSVGMIRFNSDLGVFEGYKAGSWSEIGGGSSDTWTTDNFTGDGSTAAYTLTQAPESEDNVIAFIEGVFQNPADYVVSGSTITFDDNVPNGQKVVVHTVKATVSGNNLNVDEFTGNGSNTQFTLSINPIDERNTMVYIDGVYQNKDTYSLANEVLHFAAAPASSADIEVLTFTQTSINAPTSNSVGTTSLIDDSVTSPKLAHGLTLQGNTSINGNLDLRDSDRLHLGSDDDLALFHTGGNGVIHNTTGALRIRANTLNIQDYANEDAMITANSNDSVELYFNNIKKFETTNTGVTANGTVSATTVSATTLSGSLSGTIASSTTATTQANNVANTTVATTAYVTNKVTELIGGAPGTLDTLNELAAAINDDANYNSTLTTALATKLPLAGGTLTGALVGTKASFDTASTTDYVLRLTDNGVADYDVTFPDTSTYQLQTNTTSTKTLKVVNLGSGEFNFELMGTATINGNINLDGAGYELRGKDTGGSVRTITRINGSNELEYGWSGSGPVKFMGGGSYTERMRIHTDGRIGINNASPAGMLHITSNDSTTNDSVNMLWLTALSTGTTTTGFGPAIVFQAERNSGVNQNVGKIRSVAEINSGTDISSGLAFETGEVGVLSEKFRITYDGDVGIGTDSPSFTALSGASSTHGLEIQNLGNDTAAALRISACNNTGTPGQVTNTEFIHRGDSLQTHWRHAGSDALVLNSSFVGHFMPGVSDTRMYFGSTGGIFGGNSSHWVRAASSSFMFNAGGGSGNYIFEANGQARLTIDNLGVSQIKTNKSGDNYDLYLKSQNGADPGLAIFRDGQAGFGISVRTATSDYADFIVSDGGSPDFTPSSTGGTGSVGPMRLYHSGAVHMPYSAAWSTGIGHVFGITGSHYLMRDSSSTGNETFIIANQTSTGGAIGVMQYRYQSSVRGQYLVATDSAGIYFTGSSDYRFKENVTNIPNGMLDKLTSLRPITYTHSADYDDDTSTVHTGFIAHEVQEVFPEFVEGEKDAVYTQEDLDARGDQTTVTESVGDPLYQTVAYNKKEWNVYIIKALIELKEENEALKARIEALEG